MNGREWLEIVAVVLAWTAPVWLPALAVGWAFGVWCCRQWRKR